MKSTLFQTLAHLETHSPEVFQTSRAVRHVSSNQKNYFLLSLDIPEKSVLHLHVKDETYHVLEHHISIFEHHGFNGWNSIFTECHYTASLKNIRTNQVLSAHAYYDQNDMGKQVTMKGVPALSPEEKVAFHYQVEGWTRDLMGLLRKERAQIITQLQKELRSIPDIHLSDEACIPSKKLEVYIQWISRSIQLHKTVSLFTASKADVGSVNILQQFLDKLKSLDKKITVSSVVDMASPEEKTVEEEVRTNKKPHRKAPKKMNSTQQSQEELHEIQKCLSMEPSFNDFDKDFNYLNRIIKRLFTQFHLDNALLISQLLSKRQQFIEQHGRLFEKSFKDFLRTGAPSLEALQDFSAIVDLQVNESLFIECLERGKEDSWHFLADLFSSKVDDWDRFAFEDGETLVGKAFKYRKLDLFKFLVLEKELSVNVIVDGKNIRSTILDGSLDEYDRVFQEKEYSFHELMSNPTISESARYGYMKNEIRLGTRAAASDDEWTTVSKELYQQADELFKIIDKSPQFKSLVMDAVSSCSERCLHIKKIFDQDVLNNLPKDEVIKLLSLLQQYLSGIKKHIDYLLGVLPDSKSTKLPVGAIARSPHGGPLMFRNQNSLNKYFSNEKALKKQIETHYAQNVAQYEKEYMAMCSTVFLQNVLDQDLIQEIVGELRL